MSVFTAPPRVRRRVPMAAADVVIARPRHTRRVPTAIAALLALLFFRMSLAATADIKTDCENNYLTWDGTSTPLTADDNQTRMVVGPPQYWVIVENDRFPLPTWAEPMLDKFGLLPTECR